MKTILRIFAILAVAAAIGGLVFLLVDQGSTSAAGVDSGGPADRQFGSREGFAQGNLPAGFERGMRHGRDGVLEGDGLFIWAETIRNGIVVAGLVALVALIERMLKPRRARKVAPVGVSPAGGKGNDPSA